MTDKQIWTYFGEATNYTNPDVYASDVSLSLLDPEDPSQEVDLAQVEALQLLWHVANDSFRDLLSLLELTQAKCSVRFCIPLRTIENWAMGLRTPPAYLRLMMAECMGLLDIRDAGDPPVS